MAGLNYGHWPVNEWNSINIKAMSLIGGAISRSDDELSNVAAAAVIAADLINRISRPFIESIEAFGNQTRANFYWLCCISMPLGSAVAPANNLCIEIFTRIAYFPLYRRRISFMRHSRTHFYELIHNF